jgi:hypothetical protein
MANGDLYLFGEFEQDDPDHRNAAAIGKNASKIPRVIVV